MAKVETMKNSAIHHSETAECKVGEALLLDLDHEMLGHLEFADDSAHAETNLFLPFPAILRF